jgi:hypothetical protein
MEVNSASKSVTKFAVSVAEQERYLADPVVGVQQQVAGALGHPRPAWVRCYPDETDPFHFERARPVTVWLAASSSASRVGPVRPDPPVTRTCKESSERVV